MNRLQSVLLALVLVFAVGSSSQAQIFTAGARAGIPWPVPGQPLFTAGMNLELRGLFGWPAQLGFGVRMGYGFVSGATLDVLYRMDGSAQGPLYFGGGIGFAPLPGISTQGSWALRVVVGYEWTISPEFSASFEGVAYWWDLYGANKPGLELTVGLSYRVWPPPPPSTPSKPGETPQNPNPGLPPEPNEP